MKIFAILFSSLFVFPFIFTSSFAGCGLCSPQPACGPRCIYDTPCQCTDPGVSYNTCIERCTYCEAFGNIGAR